MVTTIADLAAMLSGKPFVYMNRARNIGYYVQVLQFDREKSIYIEVERLSDYYESKQVAINQAIGLATRKGLKYYG